jgi:hypothetical protein
VIAGVASFVMNNNGDFNQPITVSAGGVPMDFTGYEAKMSIGDQRPPTVIYHTLNSTGMNPEITFPSPTMGHILLALPESVTHTFTFTNAVYDLILMPPGGGDLVFLQGNITLVQGVTTP